MEGIEGVVVMGKDEVSEGYEEMCGRARGGIGTSQGQRDVTSVISFPPGQSIA